MPENIISQFQRVFANPIEVYAKVDTLTDRDNIPAGVRYEGMQTYVTNENTIYYLRGGITNLNWTAITASGGGVVEFKGYFNPVTIDPLLTDTNSTFGDEYRVTGAAASGTNYDFGSGNILLYNDDVILFDGSNWVVKASRNATKLEGLDSSSFALLNQTNFFTQEQNVINTVLDGTGIRRNLNSQSLALAGGSAYSTGSGASSYIVIEGGDFGGSGLGGDIRFNIISGKALRVNGILKASLASGYTTALTLASLADNDWITKKHFNDNGVLATEGTFTPTLVDVGGGATYTIGTSNCNYYKIGKQVTVSIVLSNINSSGAPSSNFLLQGLPFTAPSGEYFEFNVYFNGSSTNFYSIIGEVSGSDIGFYVQTALDGNNTTTLGFQTLTNARIRISGTYFTA